MASIAFEIVSFVGRGGILGTFFRVVFLVLSLSGVTYALKHLKDHSDSKGKNDPKHKSSLDGFYKFILVLSSLIILYVLYKFTRSLINLIGNKKS